MPFYQMLCITTHYHEYVRTSPIVQLNFHVTAQKHIKELVRQTATHVMNAGGVVRNVNSWGTLTLPQRMKRHGGIHAIGERVSSLSCLSPPDLIHRTVIGPSISTLHPGHYALLILSCGEIRV